MNHDSITNIFSFFFFGSEIAHSIIKYQVVWNLKAPYPLLSSKKKLEGIELRYQEA